MLHKVSPYLRTPRGRDIHRVHSPEDQSETSDGTEEGGSLLVLVLNDTTAIDCKLVHDNQVGNAGHSVPSPLGSTLDSEGSEKTGQDHDDISDNSDEDVSTTKTREKAKIEEQEWGGEAPIDVTGPVDLTVDSLEGVWEVLLGLLDDNLVVRDAVIHSHSKVGDHSEGGNEGR